MSKSENNRVTKELLAGLDSSPPGMLEGGEVVVGMLDHL